jgi:hypothetical protein
MAVGVSTFILVRRPGRGADQLLQTLVPKLKEEMSISILYCECRLFHGFRAAGAWCWPTNAIFSEDVEERAELYLWISMITLNFMGLKRPGRGAVQLMPSLVTTLKEE